MKKGIALLMCGVMLFSAAACTKVTEKKKVETKETAGQKKDTKKDTKKTAEKKKEESKPYTKGTWNENVYTNEYLGVTFTKPESWVAATEEETETIMGKGASQLELGDTEKKAVEEGTEMTDFMISDPASGSNIIMMAENVSGALINSQIDGKKYLEVVKKSLESNEQMQYTITDQEDTQIAGKTFAAMKVASELQGTKVEQFYYCVREGDYVIAFVATPVGAGAEECTGMISSMTEYKAQ